MPASTSPPTLQHLRRYLLPTNQGHIAEAIVSERLRDVFDKVGVVRGKLLYSFTII